MYFVSLNTKLMNTKRDDATIIWCTRAYVVIPLP